MITWSYLPIRIRLTVWHTVLFGGIMLLFIVGSLGFFYLYLRQHQDAALKEDLEVISQFLRLPLDAEFRKLVQTHDPEKYERFCEVWSSSGELLYRSSELRDKALGPVPSAADSIDRFSYRDETFPDGSRLRVVGTYHKRANDVVYVRLAVSEEPLFDEISSAATILALLAPFVLLLVGVSGFFFAGSILKPIHLMSGTAKRISAENLNERLPVVNPRDELGTLAATINDLLERVHISFERLRQFTSDASHELRTPLTAMRSVGEVALQEQHSAAEYREVIGSMLEENERLTNLVEKLLFLSRADGNRMPLEHDDIDLAQLLSQVNDIMGVLAEEKGQTIATVVAAGLSTRGDRSLLKQSILDIVDNAIKYSPPGAPILVRASKESGGRILIEIEDQGPGIPADQRQKVFERFYQVDAGRSRSNGGTGLGLPIVQWIVQAHEGTVSALGGPKGGTIIRITLPASRSAHTIMSSLPTQS